MASLKTYYKRLKKQLCPKCGRKRDAGGLWCKSCIAKNRVAKMSVTLESRARYNRRYHERCREEGLCTRCGGRRDDERFIRCGQCRVKEQAYKEKINWRANGQPVQNTVQS